MIHAIYDKRQQGTALKKPTPHQLTWLGNISTILTAGINLASSVFAEHAVFNHGKPIQKTPEKSFSA